MATFFFSYSYVFLFIKTQKILHNSFRNFTVKRQKKNKLVNFGNYEKKIDDHKKEDNYIIDW